MNTIKKFINRSRVYIVLSLLAQEVLLFGVISLVLLFLWALADYFFIPSAVYLRTYYYVVALTAFGFGLRFLFTFLPFLKVENCITLIQKRFPELKDELLSVWQLGLKDAVDVSGQLIAKLMEEVQAKLASCSLTKLVNFKKIKKYSKLLFITIILLAASVLLPGLELKYSFKRVAFSMFGEDYLKYFTVTPGSKSFELAGSVSVELKSVLHLSGEPYLLIRNVNGSWEKRSFDGKNDFGNYYYNINSLTEDIEYAVFWGGHKTPVLLLSRIMPVALFDFEVKYKYPAYTRIANQTKKGDANISAPKGSVISVSAKVNRTMHKASVVINDSTPINAALNKDIVSTVFTIKKAGSYNFVFVDQASSQTVNSPGYKIQVVEDEEPKIELLSPKDDLLVSQNEVIPLIIEASDDYGLVKVELNYKIEGRAEEKTLIWQQNGGEPPRPLEYLWKLSKVHAQAGDKIKYYISAWDNDEVAGAKLSRTPTRTIEITDYQKEHDKIEAGLNDFRDSLANILADQSVAREKLKTMETAFSTATCNELIKTQEAILRQSNESLKMIGELVAKMEADPLTDFATAGEYQGIKSNLSHLSQGPMKSAIAGLKNKELKSAAKNEDEIIAELQKMTLLSEDIWKYQKMRDVIENGSVLKNSGSDLLEQIKDKAAPEQIKKTLEKLKNALADIANKLSKMPQDLPEDFINSPSIKNLDVQKSSNVADELNKALEAGDWQKVQELAEKLQKQLDEMLKTLDEVANNVGYSSEASKKMYDDAVKYGQNLEKIVNSQQEINQDIEKLETVRKKNLFDRQEKLLKELYVRQKKVVFDSEKLSSKLSEYYLQSRLQGSVLLMKKVLSEFEGGRVYYSQKYLEDIVKSLEPLGSAIKNIQQQENAKGICLEEKTILELLKQPDQSGLLGESEKKKASALADKQKKAKAETDKLRSSIEEFSRQSTAVPMQAFDNLRGAAAQMENASSQLEGSEVSGALESGQKALEALMEGSDSMQQAAQGLGEQQSKAGTGKTGSVKKMSGGYSGFSTVPVKLPGAKEYKPPREFRQEVMDALKEKFPAKYENIIKDYYRRLTE